MIFTPIDFTLTGIDDYGIEKQLVINANDNGFICHILTQSQNLTNHKDIGFNLIDGCKYLRAYNNNYGGGVPYQQRDFFKPFVHNALTICQENLIRAFAVSSGFIHFWYTNNYEQHPSRLEYYKEFPDSLSDKILIDWTGKLDIQPQMYFLPKVLTNKNVVGSKRTPALDELYNLRLLQKYEAKALDLDFENYYVPLSIPDTNEIIKSFQKQETLDLWKKIVNGINKEIRRLVRNNSSKGN